MRHAPTNPLSDRKILHNILKAASRIAEEFNFVIREAQHNLAVRTFPTHDSENAEAAVVDAVLAVHHGRDGHGGVDAGQQAFYDVANGDRDGVIQLWGGHILGEGAVSFFVTVSAALALLNLLPISDFDGGRILHCLLAPAIGLRVTGRVCELLSILSLFCLWCMSVYALIRAGGSLSLFVFSTTLFVRFFIHGPRS